MDIPIDEVVYIDAISSGSTGVAVDADSTPTFAIYEESTDTDIGVGGNMTKRTSLTGDYRCSFTCSLANGFEVGKWYSVIGSATIGGIACKGVLKNFRAVAAELAVGFPLVDAAKWLGTTIPAPVNAGYVATDMGQALPSAPVVNSVGEALFMSDIQGGRFGTAQAGAATTITLDAGASSTDNRYLGYQVYLYGGTGGGIRGTGQQRTITGYVGSTKVATVDSAWGTNPDNTSKFMLVVESVANTGMISGTTQTARDLGASVLLSSGTGTGQVKLSSGYVAPNWGDVGNPTTTNALTGTTISTTQKVDIETIKTNPVANGGTVTFPTNATLASTSNITGGTITTVTTVTNQLTAAQIATGVWQDATSGDFTVSSSIGKSLYTSGVVPGGTNGLFIAGTNAATVITTSLTTHFVGTVDTVTTVTNQLTAAAIATGVWQDATAGDFTTANSVGKSLYNAFTAGTSVFTVAALANAPTGGSAPTVSQIATAVWQDATAGDFTATGSIGKSLFTGGVVPGGIGGIFIAGTNAATTITTGLTTHFIGTIDTLTTYTGNTVQTGDAFARLGLPAGASVSADVAAVKTDTGNLVTRITSTLFSGITSLGKWLGILAGKTADSGTLTEVNATTAGAGYDNTTDSLQAIIDTVPTASQNATALLDLSNGIETSITPRQAIRLILAAEAGKLSGAATTTITIRNVGDTKDRLTATVDSSGNRTAVTTDGT